MLDEARMEHESFITFYKFSVTEFYKDYQLVTWLDDREIDEMFYGDDYYDGGWYDVTIDDSSIESKAIVTR